VRERPAGVQAQRARDGNGAGAAGQHELADGQAARGLQEVEAVAQAERMSLRAQRSACAHPAQQRAGARQLRHELVAQGAQPGDGVAHVGAVIGERDADAGARELAREQHHVVRGGAHHQSHLRLGRFHALERVSTQVQ
jgi:hypothetical protein